MNRNSIDDSGKPFHPEKSPYPERQALALLAMEAKQYDMAAEFFGRTRQERVSFNRKATHIRQTEISPCQGLRSLLASLNPPAS